MLKAVLLDMDGLMFDTEILYCKFWQEAGEQLGIPDGAEISKMILGMTDDGAEEYLHGIYGPEIPVKRFRELVNIIKDDYYATHRVDAKPGLRALLTYLKQNGYKVAVASSSPKYDIELHLSREGITQYIDVIANGSEVKNSKPAPDIFLLAAERLGLAPEECIVVEDSPFGIRAARAAGMSCVFVKDLVDVGEVAPLCSLQVAQLNKIIPYLEAERSRTEI